MKLEFNDTDIAKILAHLLYLYNPCLENSIKRFYRDYDKEVDKFYCSELDAIRKYPNSGLCDDLSVLEARLNEEFDGFRQPGGFPIPDSFIETPEYQTLKRKKRNQKRFKNGIIKLFGESKTKDGIEFVRCMVTGSFYPKFIVDAAHLYPHHASREEDPRNGLLIRTDIHALFDAQFIGIKLENDSFQIEVGNYILTALQGSAQGTESLVELLEQINNKKLVFRKGATIKPWKEAILYRYQWFKAVDLYRTKPSLGESGIAKEVSRLTGSNIEKHISKWLDDVSRRRNPDNCFSSAQECLKSEIKSCHIKVMAARCVCEQDNFLGNANYSADDLTHQQPRCAFCNAPLSHFETIDAAGIELKTPTGNRYQLLLANIYHQIYQHYHKTNMHAMPGWPEEGYRYVISIDALNSGTFEEIFKAFRLLFMGDLCVDPFLGGDFNRLTQPQREALHGGLDIFQKGFLPSVAAGERAGILSLPTGMGKTKCALVTYDIMCEVLGRPPRLLFLAEQLEHVKNGQAEFQNYITAYFEDVPKTEIAYGGMKASFSKASIAIFATRQTLYEQLFADHKAYPCPRCQSQKNKSCRNEKKEEIAPHLERCVPLVSSCPICKAGPGMGCIEDTEPASVYTVDAKIFRAHKARFGSKKEVYQYFDYIIVDECHHAGGNQYQTLLNYFEPKYCLGLTATPFRTDMVYIENIFGTDGYCKGDGNIIYRMAVKTGLDVAQCIRDGYLSQISYLLVNDITENKGENPVSKDGTTLNFDTWQEAQEKITLDAKMSSFLQEYKKLAITQFNCSDPKNPEGIDPGRLPKTLIFCGHEKVVGKEKSATPGEVAKMVADYLNRQLAGGKQCCVASPYLSDTSQSESVLEQFKQRESELKILTAVSKFDEGIDVKFIEVIVFLTRSESEGRQLQRLGRGLRLASDKRVVHVIDLESNYASLRTLLNNGVVGVHKATSKTFGRGENTEITMNSIARCKTSHKSALVELLESGKPWSIKCGSGETQLVISSDQVKTIKNSAQDGLQIEDIIQKSFGIQSFDKYSTYLTLAQSFVAEIDISDETSQRRYISGLLNQYAEISEKVVLLHQERPPLGFGIRAPSQDSLLALKSAIGEGKSIIPVIQQMWVDAVPNLRDEFGKHVQHYFDEAMVQLVYMTKQSEDIICRLIEELGLASKARELKKKIGVHGWSIGAFTASCIATLKEMTYVSDNYRKLTLPGGIDARIDELYKAASRIERHGFASKKSKSKEKSGRNKPKPKTGRKLRRY